ncbi:MAG: LPS export ABC transporter periplasmic protein LptC [Bacteroidales bacterium]|nr:LPS export ABC transporter periplasmic protein LptC [Candidatus Cryptobacteroides caccocaballi]
MIATASAVAFVVYSCNDNTTVEDGAEAELKPIQTVDNMFVVQTLNGDLQLRMEADRMERYQNDSTSWELFPDGFAAYMYQVETGKLETTIFADQAKHVKPKSGDEIWQAFGNVRVRNEINDETMETDTLYWDREKETIFTDCYVKMYSNDGFMQGYGMISDQRADNTIIRKPFDSYGVVVQDSTAVIIDTANFIGPLLKK